MKAYDEVQFSVAKTSEDLPKSRSSFESFARTLALRECRPSTIIKHLRLLRVLALHFPSCDISKLSRNDLESFMLWLIDSQHSKGTREEIKMSVRLFYKLMGLGSIVDWIKARKLKSTLESTAILFEEEVYSMIQAAPNLRDKALIAILSDTGMRPEELLALKFIDIDLSGYPCHAFLDGKTGKRSVPLTFCVPYIARYLDSTPRLYNGYLWLRDQKSHSVGKLGNVGLNHMLKNVARSVGIKKRVYAYLFRHSAYTRDSKKYPEAILKLKYGWCKGSEMPEVYGHLDHTDLDKVVLGEMDRSAETLQQRLERIESNQRFIISKLQ